MAKLVTQVRKIHDIIKQQKKIKKIKKREQKDNGSWLTKEFTPRYTKTSKSLHIIENLVNADLLWDSEKNRSKISF